MSQQLTLSYRATDPETSRLASAESNAKANNRTKVLDALAQLGTATRSEIAQAARLPDDSCTSRRLRDLEEAGLVRKTGVVRAGASGASQSVWELT